MTTTGSNIPKRCPLCEYYLTTHAEYSGYRCLDPGHWQAAGLAPNDFYAIARVVAIGQTAPSSNSPFAEPR